MALPSANPQQITNGFSAEAILDLPTGTKYVGVVAKDVLGNTTIFDVDAGDAGRREDACGDQPRGSGCHRSTVCRAARVSSSRDRRVWWGAERTSSGFSRASSLMASMASAK